MVSLLAHVHKARSFDEKRHPHLNHVRSACACSAKPRYFLGLRTVARRNWKLGRGDRRGALAIAIFMAPAIHLFFGFFVGWSDYMPFIPVRSLKSLLHG